MNEIYENKKINEEVKYKILSEHFIFKIENTPYYLFVNDNYDSPVFFIYDSEKNIKLNHSKKKIKNDNISIDIESMILFLQGKINILFLQIDFKIKILIFNKLKQTFKIIHEFGENFNYITSSINNSLHTFIDNENFSLLGTYKYNKKNETNKNIVYIFYDKILKAYNFFETKEKQYQTVHYSQRHLNNKIMIECKDYWHKSIFNKEIYLEVEIFNENINIKFYKKSNIEQINIEPKQLGFSTFKNKKIRRVTYYNNLAKIEIEHNKNVFKTIIINLDNKNVFIPQKNSEEIIDIFYYKKDLLEITEKVIGKQLLFSMYINKQKIFQSIKSKAYGFDISDFLLNGFYKIDKFNFIDLKNKEVLREIKFYKKNETYECFIHKNFIYFNEKNKTIKINKKIDISKIEYLAIKKFLNDEYLLINYLKSTVIIYDIKANKVLDYEYNFSKNNEKSIEEQLAIFLSQNDFERTKTNIINKISYEPRVE